MSQLTVYFVRHGVTKNNVLGRVQGRKDALLSEEGRAALHKLRREYDYPAVEKLYTSPAARARETAEILYPDMELTPVEGFWEYSFGQWEGRLMSDIAKEPMFDKWMDQSWDCRFEGGESLLEASFRARAAMTRVILDARDNGLSKIAIVAHGEIFNLLFRTTLAAEHVDPADLLLCPNGMGLVATVDPEEWLSEQKLQFQEFFPVGAPRPKAEDSPYFQQRKG